MFMHPEPGKRTSYAYVAYRMIEWKGSRKEACANCDLPVGLCEGKVLIECRPEQRDDGKQIIFKRRYTIKKRERRK